MLKVIRYSLPTPRLDIGAQVAAKEALILVAIASEVGPEVGNNYSNDTVWSQQSTEFTNNLSATSSVMCSKNIEEKIRSTD